MHACISILLLNNTVFPITFLRRYFFSLENWLEVVLIGLTLFLLLFPCDADHLSASRHVAAVAIVLAWSEWITMVGRHPRLSTYNIYVTMFYKVTSTFIMFLVWCVIGTSNSSNICTILYVDTHKTHKTDTSTRISSTSKRVDGTV